MYRFSFSVPEKDVSVMSRMLFSLGAASVSEIREDDATVTLIALTENPESFKNIPGCGALDGEYLNEEIWKYKWLEDLKGFEVNPCLYVQPVTSSSGGQGDYDITLYIDPRDAFGDGKHPTTLLCLRMLWEHMQVMPPGERKKASCLDAGTGTGILAVLAEKMGCGDITAFDVDGDSCLMAEKNIALNGCDNITVLQEDVFSPSEKIKGPYDIVCANLLSDILIRSGPALAAMTASDGVLLVSGIIDRWAGDVLQIFEGNAMTPIVHEKLDGWNAFLMARR